MKEQKAQKAEDYLRNLGMTLRRIREDTVNEESSTPTKRKRVSKRKVRKNKKRAKYAQLYKLTVNLGVCIQR